MFVVAPFFLLFSVKQYATNAPELPAAVHLSVSLSASLFLSFSTERQEAEKFGLGSKMTCFPQQNVSWPWESLWLTSPLLSFRWNASSVSL